MRTIGRQVDRGKRDSSRKDEQHGRNERYGPSEELPRALVEHVLGASIARIDGTLGTTAPVQKQHGKHKLIGPNYRPPQGEVSYFGCDVISASEPAAITFKGAFDMALPDRKRLGNTPFRREACVVKWLDE